MFAKISVALNSFMMHDLKPVSDPALWTDSLMKTSKNILEAILNHNNDKFRCQQTSTHIYIIKMYPVLFLRSCFVLLIWDAFVRHIHNDKLHGRLTVFFSLLAILCFFVFLIYFFIWFPPYHTFLPLAWASCYSRDHSNYKDKAPSNILPSRSQQIPIPLGLK